MGRNNYDIKFKFKFINIFLGKAINAKRGIQSSKKDVHFWPTITSMHWIQHTHKMSSSSSHDANSGSHAYCTMTIMFHDSFSCYWKKCSQIHLKTEEEGGVKKTWKKEETMHVIFDNELNIKSWWVKTFLYSYLQKIKRKTGQKWSTTNRRTNSTVN